MWDFPPGFRRGGRARRGNVRAAILALLKERPMHGYEIISELGERSGGLWRPSPGSVYPTLQLLEDEGLITGTEAEGRRQFTLTTEGRAAAEEAASRQPPWERGHAKGGPAFELRDAVGKLAMAARQVAVAGDAEQAAEAVAILTEARRRLYQLLAEETGPTAV